MRRTSRLARSFRLALAVCVGVGLAGCDGDAEPSPDAGVLLGDGFVRLQVTGPTKIRLVVSRALAPDGVSERVFSVQNVTRVPPVVADVVDARLEGGTTVVLETSALEAGQPYTLLVDGLLDVAGRPIDGSLNFIAEGEAVRVPVEVVVDDVDTAARHDGLAILASVDAETGAFSETLVSYPMVREADRFVARMEVAVDPSRTASRGDDGDTETDRRGYGALVVDDFGRAIGPMGVFELPSAEADRTWVVTVLPPPESPEDPPGPVEVLPPPPVDDDPDDGRKLVRLVVDDRAARALVSPQLAASFTEDGAFDDSFTNLVELTEDPDREPGFYEAVVSVAVDPTRVADGVTPETFPYFVYLVDNDVDYEGISTVVVAPDETPETLPIALGNPEWTPVTFRVDASAAYLTADGSARGVYDGEAVYLTGEWQRAVDALGRNCGDAFSGGEQLNLKMVELPGLPGVWQRTLWLPPGRPYGWKVLRCDADLGCGPLNQLVSSSGRAFATVMKNLATDNVDAFVDPGVGLVDPLSPSTTQAGGQILDYTNAVVWEGTDEGRAPDPDGTPDGARMFKQEAPDLVVIVGDVPLKTRVFHVGTWRDVNLGQTPAEIIESSSPVTLGPIDYDDGMQGRYPPSREEP